MSAEPNVPDQSQGQSQGEPAQSAPAAPSVPLETKYVVKIYPSPNPRKVPKAVSLELKGVASGKQISRMKKESVDCPLVQREVSFLVCFACPSFIRRVKGEVDCAGIKPPPAEWLL